MAVKGYQLQKLLLFAHSSVNVRNKQIKAFLDGLLFFFLPQTHISRTKTVMHELVFSKRLTQDMNEFIATAWDRKTIYIYILVSADNKCSGYSYIRGGGVAHNSVFLIK